MSKTMETTRGLSSGVAMKPRHQAFRLQVGTPPKANGPPVHGSRLLHKTANLISSLFFLALATAESKLSLLSAIGDGLRRHIQAQLGRHLRHLFGGELGQGVGDLVSPFAFHVGLRKDNVNLLQRTASSLTVEKPGERNSGEVDQGKEEVNTPGTGRGEDRSEHDDSKVADPVGASGGRGSHSTQCIIKGICPLYLRVYSG